MSARILVVDDELAIRRLVRAALTRDGHAVEEAGDVRAGLATVATCDLVLLDLGLPDRDGLEAIGPFRRAGAAVIVLTARDEGAEKVAALDLGADDYVTKPFDTDELLARIRACLRRRAGPGADADPDRIVAGAIEIDTARHAVTHAGETIRLTPKEFALLECLARHPGRVLTHARILGEVWGPANVGDVEYLRVAMRALRRKIETDPARPRLLLNEPGVGYRLVEE